MKTPDIVIELAGRLNRPVSEIQPHYEATIRQLSIALSKKETLSLTGVGTIGTRNKPEREAHHPDRIEKITIAEHRNIFFRVSRVLRDKVKDVKVK